MLIVNPVCSCLWNFSGVWFGVCLVVWLYLCILVFIFKWIVIYCFFNLCVKNPDCILLAPFRWHFKTLISEKLVVNFYILIVCHEYS